MFSVIHHIPNVLSKEQVAEFRQMMETANWVEEKLQQEPFPLQWSKTSNSPNKILWRII